jgi:hypothetical protein
MKHGTDQFDDSGDPTRSPAAGRRRAAPRLTPGPHQQELRRALMREARELFERRAAAAGTGRVPLPPALSHWFARFGRFAFAAGAVVVVVAGLLWVAFQQQRGGGSAPPSVARRTATTTNQATGRGFSAVLGLGAPAVDTRTSAAIRNAIDKSQVQLDRVLPTTDGSRTYIYRTTSGGESIVFASSRVLATKSVTSPIYEQEFEQAVTRGKGRVVGEAVSELGSRVWRYRVALSNGLGETYGAEREPDDAGIRERHKNALNAAMINGSGEVAQALPGVDGKAVVLVKVTLDDGTIKTYAGPAQPGGM